MGHFQDWVVHHIFDLLSTLGIVSGLLFTGFSLRAEQRSKRLANLITLTQHHREIWEATLHKPELRRVTDPTADLEGQPITPEESQFVVLVVLHLHCWFRAIQNREVRGVEGLSRDVKQFFSLPIPDRLWVENRLFYDQDFIDFVEAARESGSADPVHT